LVADVVGCWWCWLLMVLVADGVG